MFAYDIGDRRRRARVARLLTGYRVGGQKSVPECWVTPGELDAIRTALVERIDGREDRVHVLGLDPRMQVRCLGLAVAFEPGFFSVL